MYNCVGRSSTCPLEPACAKASCGKKEAKPADNKRVLPFLSLIIDEPLKSHKNVSLLTMREVYFMLSTDVSKISLFVRDDK
jgi:hypothetical protein